MLIHPWWIFARVLSNVLPHDHAYRFRDGSDCRPHALVIQLWGPGSKFVVYDGRYTRQKIEVDEQATEEWGILSTARSSLRGEKEIDMEQGGL